MIRVLTGGTLIDGTGAAPVRDAAVVIDGDRVMAAGPRTATAWPANAEIVLSAEPVVLRASVLTWRNVFTGAKLTCRKPLPANELFREFPVAVLCAEGRA